MCMICFLTAERVCCLKSEAARDCDYWGCCNSSQQRVYKDWKVSGFPQCHGLLRRMTMTFIFLRAICETSVYCYAAVTCYCLTHITFISQSFSGKEMYVQKHHNSPTATVSVALSQYIENRNTCDHKRSISWDKQLLFLEILKIVIWPH